MEYDPLRRVTFQSSSDGAVTSTTFDAAGRISNILNVACDATVSDLAYAYDHTGHRTLQVEGDGTRTTWTFDDVYQLTREQRNGDDGFDISYTYDAAGNRTLAAEAGGAVTTSMYSTAISRPSSATLRGT
jgi:YD repeat-containing protein